MRALKQHLGERLKQLREEQGLRAADAAALVGVDRTHLYNIERGVANASLDMIIALAMLYKVDVTDLFVFPVLHPRHALREILRLIPNAKMDEAREALARVASSTARPTRKTK